MSVTDSYHAVVFVYMAGQSILVKSQRGLYTVPHRRIDPGTSKVAAYASALERATRGSGVEDVLRSAPTDGCGFRDVGHGVRIHVTACHVTESSMGALAASSSLQAVPLDTAPARWNAPFDQFMPEMLEKLGLEHGKPQSRRRWSGERGWTDR